jgi:hypothetical protein
MSGTGKKIVAKLAWVTSIKAATKQRRIVLLDRPLADHLKQFSEGKNEKTATTLASKSEVRVLHEPGGGSPSVSAWPVKKCDVLLAIMPKSSKQDLGKLNKDELLAAMTGNVREAVQAALKKDKPMIVIWPGDNGDRPGGDVPRDDGQGPNGDGGPGGDGPGNAPHGGSGTRDGLRFFNFPHSSNVYWLIQAHDRLENSLAKLIASGKRLEDLRQAINSKLRWTFPDAKAILVTDYVEGFRQDPNNPVLRTEVYRAGEPSARVVKIAEPDKLKDEWLGYKSCMRRSNNRGRRRGR